MFYKTCLSISKEILASAHVRSRHGAPQKLPFCFMVDFLSGDSTKSAAFQESKVQNLRVQSCFFGVEDFNYVSYPRQDTFDDLLQRHEVRKTAPIQMGPRYNKSIDVTYIFPLFLGCESQPAMLPVEILLRVNESGSCLF